MSSDQSRKYWGPYLVIVFGFVISILFGYLLWLDNQADNIVMNKLEHHLYWIIVVVGFGITLLLAGLTRAAQLASYRAISLDHINENLKREIAERINMEESKERLEMALNQGQKLQAMGTLAGGIAHDFNNLLYAIIGYVEMARDDVDKSSKIYRNLGKVLEAAARGQELVARILAFSRRQHQDKEILDLRATIEAALSLLRPAIPASVTIRLVAEHSYFVKANQTQLHQVLVNLVNNAVDAMDGEGIITIRLAHAKKQDRGVESLRLANPGQNEYCKIEVSDSGHGMDQPTLQRIFEPFYTTKEVGKGTGLGLSIVHSIIKEHNGEITAQSRLGHGSKFVILLPEQIQQC